MPNYEVYGEDLTAVANAIRTKADISGSLSFPSGFVSAIGDIGGGGSSDFSTARVTLVNSGAPTAPAYLVNNIPYVYDNAIRTNTFYVTTSVTVDVPIYKGIAYYSASFDYVNQNVMPTFSGGVSFDIETGYFIVTGDGTFTALGMGADE